MKRFPVLPIAAVLIMAVTITGIILYTTNTTRLPQKVTTAKDVQMVTTPPDSTTPSAVNAHTTSQNDMLKYLIEEEKLAHDVYTMLNEKYGTRVFGNILSSEQNHQSQVLTLLQARDIPDPRSTELGVFNNAELQALYDQLIAQGSQNATEAYEVGVAIEEKDIADITKQLATATDSDIVATLDRLRTGSENHLRSFNRQLSRY